MNKKLSKKLSARELLALKAKRPVCMVTCYDRQMAFWINQTPIDAILIGDTLGEIIYGYPDSTHVSMDLMIEHTRAVALGAPNIHIIGDMPFQSYETPASALRNAQRFIAAGADSIKMENPEAPVIQALRRAGLSVCGHIGLTPQTIQDYKKQGRDEASAKKIKQQASMLAHEDCYAIVLEAIPRELAAAITHDVSSITIGIAAGKTCDGQIRVLYDIAGLTEKEQSFAPPIARLGEELRSVILSYIEDIAKPH